MSAPRKMRVAVIGAGIGGLTLAVALGRYPHIEVEIYEQAKQLAELGAGIGFFRRAWKILQELGLDEELQEKTEVRMVDGPVPSLRYRKSDQEDGFEFYQIVTNGPLSTFHRADFQSVLLSHLSSKSCRTHTSKRLVGYTQAPPNQSSSSSAYPITLQFADGSTSYCDILVGADGYKSVVRKGILSEMASVARSMGRMDEAARLMSVVEPRWTGSFAYRCLIDSEKLRRVCPNHRVFRGPHQFLGEAGYIISYPIQHGRLVNFVAFVFHPEQDGMPSPYQGPWVQMGEQKELRERFKGWEAEVGALIDCVEKPLRWAIHTVNDLPSYSLGRVCLLGDAAHAQAPHQGNGAGQAVEDAYLLSNLLSHPRTLPHSLPSTLRIYDEIRRPFTHDVQERSNRNGRFFSLDPQETAFLRGMNGYRGGYVNGHGGAKEHWRVLGERVWQNWQWAWNSTIDGDVTEAMRRMDSVR